ncbi:Eco57I restriction-modification methylase domain-containing protein [Paenarthrobacter sp. TA1.8]|uniref:Eco57I restriction-modification methylase domain-containing protein n=1 Tax=Paenarthrobacter sp. TA1.8 TaxID=3400219 RepID=UPI003B42AD60
MRLNADRVVTWSDASQPVGIVPQKVYLGPDPFGLGGFQVAVGTAVVAPTRQALRDLFTARKGKTQIQLVVAVVHDGAVIMLGPDPQAQSITLPVEQAERQLQSVLSEPDVLAATERFAGFRKASDSTGVAGFTNSGLFATHHIMDNVPKRSDWDVLGNQAVPLLSLRKKQLIEALGFKTQVGPNGTLLLSIDGRPPRAVAVLLDDTEQFDTKTQRFQLSPVAFGLAVASRQEVPWLVVLRKDQIRLYPGRDGVGVGSKGQADTFFEVDLSTIDSSYAALLPLIFSARALTADNTTDELLRDSARYATELGARLRERIYDKVVPPVAVEVARRLEKHAGVKLDAYGLSTAYRVTLRILFRLLFQAYAEDRGLLPSGRNEGFDANSLKANARRLLDSDTEEFGDASTIWLDLVQVWNAIDHGNPQWQVPSYNGGLFSTDPKRSSEGALIKKIELPDSVLGPALKSLLIDASADGVLGPVDFRSLSVREFGTIYEGLLESSLSLAEEDLTVDTSGAWVPAKKGDQVWAPGGSVYFHTASGERKATGSYFTPKVVVDHLIERSIVPALTAHLEKIAGYLSKGDAATAAREFFDFRVADLAMGSGHFLVAAVDKIEALMRTFLTEHTVPGVTEELLRLAGVAKEALGSDEVAKSEVDEIGLLRRQVARRCIYGLDINPMAVELARLALWIHTFVPGLPMSNLDHGLVSANSLTGIGTIEEALDALQPGRIVGAATIFDDIILDNLASAKTLLIDVANASEANKAEVEEGSRLLAEARSAADTARRIFDAAVAARIGEIHPGAILDEDSLQRVLDLPEVAEAAERLQPAHMPFLFPEVFLRDHPGFDVLLGNPPWEKLHVEEHQWWGLRLPGLRSMPTKQRDATLAAFRVSRSNLEEEYLAEIERVRAMAKAVSSGPYTGLGAAHLDLYQAFAWRNWQLLRAAGRSALVLPRGALAGSSLTAWRREILSQGSFADVCFLLNNQQWVFPEVHPQYTIGLTVLEKGGNPVVRWSGPFASKKDFLKGADDLADVPGDEFVSWSNSAAFPLIPDGVSAQVFRQMKKVARFDSVRQGWEFRPIQGDLNASSDRRVMEFDTEATRDRIPVVAGASYNLWDPNAGTPFAYGDPKVLRPHLASKVAGAVRNSRSAYNGLKFAPNTLPMDAARIAFRDIARATDTRTAIPCLVPPGTAAVHQSPLLVRRQGDEKAEAFLLGVMSSIPFDWGARRWVELHLTFELLNALPVPVYDPDSGGAKRVVEIAGRLAARDDRYADWAAEVGVPVGSVKTPAEKDDLITELDAIVGLLYGLSEDQVEHVFSTFHRGWTYETRLDMVLQHYRAWKGKA